MTALICGSIAYDTIMRFDGRFENHILPGEVNALNVAFLAPEMRREFGGCAGNIAYNLNMLGLKPKIMGAVGKDYEPYSYRFKKQSISEKHIRILGDSFTAQAFITTDQEENQITVFHPGAMNFSHLNHVDEASDIALGIVAPDGREGMLVHAEEFAASGIPFIFDPGQGLPMFSGAELLRFIDMATYVITNEYEAKLLANRTGKSPGDIAQLTEAFVITEGEKGSKVYSKDKLEIISPVIEPKPVDPTGCGDAFRAGLIFGLLNQLDWPSIGRLGSLLGAIKVASQGPQNHKFELHDIKARYKDHFGTDM